MDQKKAKNVHLAAVFAGLVAIILLWRGIWEISAKLFSAEFSLVLGAAIIAAIAVVEKRPIYKFFGWG